jgi:hypothetical protein
MQPIIAAHALLLAVKFRSPRNDSLPAKPDIARTRDDLPPLTNKPVTLGAKANMDQTW